MGNAAKNNGCLGPKKREKDVYADLIDLIHEQAQTMELGVQIDAKNLNELMAKIKKKGTIRKLTDHLSSHRSKLSDSIYHNLKIVVQVRNIRNTFIGLYIVDQIVKECKENKNADYASYQEEDFAPTSPLSPTKTTSNRQLQRSTSANFETVGKGAMDIKFEGSYFKFILQMLKFQQLLYVKILQSIDMFCSTRKQKLTCKSQVSKVIDIIIQHLKLNQYVDEGSRTYLNLISLTKQGLKNQYVNENDLMLFITLWLKDKQKTIEAPQVEGEQENSQYELIIKQIIIRCISSWNLTKIIFSTLLVVYDEDKFTGYRVMQIQSLFLKTVAEDDLHFQIFRNLFIYLIEYLSDPEINNKKYTQDLAMQSFQHPKYLHVSQQISKIHGFETLRRWQEQKYVNLNQLISYNCQILVKAYILNINSDKQFGKQITQQFLKMNALISQKSNFMIINLLLEQIRWDLTREQLKSIMVTLIRQILESRKLFQMPCSDFAAFFLPIGHHFTPQSRVQFIQLTGFVVRHLNLQELVKEVDSNNMSVSFCQFLYSIYEGLLIIDSQDKLTDCFLYIKAINNFLKGFCEKQLFGFVAGFVKSLKNKIITNVQNSSVLSLYMQLHVFYQGLFLLDSTQQIPDLLITLNKQMTNSTYNKEIESKIVIIISELVTGGSSSKHPQEINKATNISPRYDKEATALFDLYFKPTNKQEQANQQPMPYRKSQFSVRTLNNQFYNSVQSKNPFEIDESFKNVFGGINDM